MQDDPEAASFRNIDLNVGDLLIRHLLTTLNFLGFDDTGGIVIDGGIVRLEIIPALQSGAQSFRRESKVGKTLGESGESGIRI